MITGTGRVSESSYYLELYKTKGNAKTSDEKADPKSGKLVTTIIEKPKPDDSDSEDRTVELFQTEFLLEDLENLCLADIAKSHSNGAAVMKKVDSVMEAQVTGLMQKDLSDSSSGKKIRIPSTCHC